MRIPIVLIVAAATLAGCRPDDQRTETIDAREQGARPAMSEEALARLDSGNAAFRAQDFEGALTHYRRVSELEPDQSPGWFGIHMAQTSLGNDAAADSALRKVQSLAPGASLVHPTSADTAR
jgi:Flp pilus assembly protein TadD